MVKLKKLQNWVGKKAYPAIFIAFFNKNFCQFDYDFDFDSITSCFSTLSLLSISLQLDNSKNS